MSEAADWLAVEAALRQILDLARSVSAPGGASVAVVGQTAHFEFGRSSGGASASVSLGGTARHPLTALRGLTVSEAADWLAVEAALRQILDLARSVSAPGGASVAVVGQTARPLMARLGRVASSAESIGRALVSFLHGNPGAVEAGDVVSIVGRANRLLLSRRVGAVRTDASTSTTGAVHILNGRIAAPSAGVSVVGAPATPAIVGSRAIIGRDVRPDGRALHVGAVGRFGEARTNVVLVGRVRPLIRGRPGSIATTDQINLTGAARIIVTARTAGSVTADARPSGAARSPLHGRPGAVTAGVGVSIIGRSGTLAATGEHGNASAGSFARGMGRIVRLIGHDASANASAAAIGQSRRMSARGRPGVSRTNGLAIGRAASFASVGRRGVFVVASNSVHITGRPAVLAATGTHGTQHEFSGRPGGMLAMLARRREIGG